MGKLTHTVLGNPVSFKSADKSNIESLKVYFSPIQEGTGDPSSSNVRPIYGHKSLRFYHTGKNLFNTMLTATSDPLEIDSFCLGYSYASSRARWMHSTTTFSVNKIEPGYISLISNSSTTAYGVTYTLSAKPNQTYTLSFITTNGRAVIQEWNKNLEYITGVASNSSPITFTTTSNTDLFVISFIPAVGNTTITFSNIQLEFGSAATTYEPYNGNHAEIDWTSQGTLYGGYIDLITGTLVSNTIVFNLTGSEDYLTYQSNTHRLRIKDFNLTYGWSSIPPIGNVFKTATDSSFSVYFATTSQGNQNLNLGFPSDYTEEQARNFIAQNNVQVVCKVSHTTTYQLTPQQLKTFCGQNNIWSNISNDIEVTYEFTDHMAKRRLELNTPHIETLSNSLITFNTDLKAPLQECKFTFGQTYSETGAFSPNNPRSFTGLSGITLSHNETNTNNSNIYTLDWSSSPGAIYGGQIDILNGTITRTHLYKTNVGVNAFNAGRLLNDQFGIGSYMSNQPGKNIVTVLSDIFPTFFTDSNPPTFPYIYCYTVDSKPGYTYFMFMLGYLSEHPEIDTNNLFPTMRACFENYLSQYNMTTLNMFYDNGTALKTYSLTPQEIKSFKGENTLSCNATGNFDIKYWTH